MRIDRRSFLYATLGLSSGLTLSSSVAATIETPRFKAIAFDALVIFDVRPVAALAEKLFPGHGAGLTELWRTRQFEYTWLRTASARYSDFMHVTGDALVFAAEAMKLDLTPDNREQLLGAYLKLGAWPDVAAALDRLRRAGLDLAILSNFTSTMLDGCISASGLGRTFHHLFSTDVARTYKPDPRAYQLGVDGLKCQPEEILFVAFAGWDAAGAKFFGYPTFWVNRLGLPPEELGVGPDGAGADLDSLIDYVGA